MESNPFAAYLKALSDGQLRSQREYAAKELKARNIDYGRKLAKVAEEEKKLDAEAATANKNMEKAMEW